MKKIEERDLNKFYYGCEDPECRGYETELKKVTKENVDEQPPRCPKCGK